MSDTPPPEPLPESKVQTHRRPIQLIWLIPLVAAAIAGFLGWRAYSTRGPTITITWVSGDGLQAGQTRVRHKAVELGTVRSVVLSADMSHVIATVEMQRQATRFLTRSARFWVVRPRISLGALSGLETLVSGSYIELDPGSPGDPPETSFTGLEEPPPIRSDEPGRTFTLEADRIGSLASGSPVFYRDIPVGEVLGFELSPNGRQITLPVFIRAPYDQFVHEGSHFWNASGVSINLGANGVRLRMESLRAVLTGGVAFDTTAEETSTPISPPGATFHLYPDESTAHAAGYRERVAVVSYVEGSVRGLSVGAPVELYGIQVGEVTSVQLEFDATTAVPRVAVHMEIQPERVLRPAAPRPPIDVARGLVARGMRVQLQTANYLTGQLLVALDFFPNASPAEADEVGNEIVLPSVQGGLNSITAGLTSILATLNRLPLEEIAKNLNDTLAGTNAIANGAELREALHALADTMTTARDTVRRLNAGVAPALARVPDIAQSLQETLDHANRLLASTNTAYGQGSQFSRDLERLLSQASDAARSIHLLADYLDQHPEALVRGRTGGAGD
jgi:paraquat-inducible protein B